MTDMYMEEAIKQAEKAFNKQEVPVGAIIVCNEKIIAKSYNKIEKRKSIFGHAEINVIKKAMKTKKDWRLNDCELYVTLEPCHMCKEIIKKVRIKKVVFGVKNKETNKKIKEMKLIENNNQIKRIEKLIKEFFKQKR